MDRAYMEPQELLELVAAMRAQSAPTTEGSIAAPTIGVAGADEMLAALARRVEELPAELAAQIGRLGNAFVQAAADVIAADQVRPPYRGDGPPVQPPSREDG